MIDKLRTLLVPADAMQAGRIKVWAAGALSYASCSAVQMVEVGFGLISRQVSDPLIGGMLGSALVFYLLIRSGLNLRLGSDARLTLLQLSLGAGFGLWSYAVTGPARGAILTILVSTLVFGVFSLPPRQSRALAVGTMAALAGVMAWLSHRDPQNHPWRLELVHWLFTAIVMFTMATLSGQLSALRSKLGQQAKALKQAMEQLQQLATRDELTQIHNRRHLGELMANELRRQERNDMPMCVALLDIDLFKSINDRFGHAAGDKVLQRFAALAQEVLRQTDLLGRWGGEEFLVLLPDTPIQQAPMALERLRLRLQRESFDEVAPGLRVTFSAGLTPCVRGEAIQLATERADQAMYAAKRGGRDRIMVMLHDTTVTADCRGVALPVDHPLLAMRANPGDAPSAGTTQPPAHYRTKDATLAPQAAS